MELIEDLKMVISVSRHLSHTKLKACTIFSFVDFPPTNAKTWINIRRRPQQNIWQHSSDPSITWRYAFQYVHVCMHACMCIVFLCVCVCGSLRCWHLSVIVNIFVHYSWPAVCGMSSWWGSDICLLSSKLMSCIYKYPSVGSI